MDTYISKNKIVYFMLKHTCLHYIYKSEKIIVTFFIIIILHNFVQHPIFYASIENI